MHVHVTYNTIGYSIKFIRGRFEKSPLGIASVDLFIPAAKLAQTHSPNIRCFDSFTSAEMYHVAKGIFHLGLLDAKVEEVLGVSVSEHDRVEWLVQNDKLEG